MTHRSNRLPASRTGKPPRMGPLDGLMTPPELLDIVRRLGPIALDPCASANTDFHLASVNFDGSSGKDGLTRDWKSAAEGGVTYANPPYGRNHMSRWASKIATEADAGAEIVALVRQSMGSKWFQDHLAPRVGALCVLRGRVRFHDPVTGKQTSGGGKFDSVVLYFGPRAGKFIHVFKPSGWTVRP